MRKLYVLSLSVAVAVLMSIGCSQNSKSDSPVIAKVDKGAVTEEDFLREISRVPEWARTQFKDSDGKNKFLDELIKKELIYQNAKKMRLHNDKEYLDKVNEFKKMTLVALSLKKEVDDKVRVDESEAKAFFDENEDKFTIGTEIRASHILVKTEDEANNVLAKLNKGESFDSLARSLSADKTSAEKGGDLGYFGRGRMVPEFERAALSLKPGETSNPVKTRFGYHIIKLIDVKKGDPANFEQSKEAIRRDLINKKRKQLFDTYVERLTANTDISRNEDVLSGIALPWETAEENQQPSPEQSDKPSTREEK
jgi:peptidyl-prolyl cis-trans isomerase C